MPYVVKDWLAEHVEVPADLTAEQLAAALVRVGLEEEAIHGSGVTGPLVVGEVVSRVPEEQKNGKTINWCQVDVGAHNALDEAGDPTVPRGIVCGGLAATGRVRFAEPDGAFYLFFQVEGETDTRRLGLRLVDEANIGIAPGDAFGEAGRGFMRLCFLRSAEQIEEATGRLAEWLRRR